VRGTFNVATGVETSVMELYGAVQSAAGKRIDPHLAPLRPGELERSCLDPTRALEMLGWRAEIGIDQGVEETYHTLIQEFEETPAQAG
jgi:UDP-glucose 4-epimerase